MPGPREGLISVALAQGSRSSVQTVLVLCTGLAIGRTSSPSIHFSRHRESSSLSSPSRNFLQFCAVVIPLEVAVTASTADQLQRVSSVPSRRVLSHPHVQPLFLEQKIQ